MAYRIRKTTQGRLARLEAVITAGATCDAETDEEVTASISNELWLLVASGVIGITTAGRWGIQYDNGQPRYNVPDGLLDSLNWPGWFRDLAEIIVASGDTEYTVCDDDGRSWTYTLIDDMG